MFAKKLPIVHLLDSGWSSKSVVSPKEARTSLADAAVASILQSFLHLYLQM